MLNQKMTACYMAKRPEVWHKPCALQPPESMHWERVWGYLGPYFGLFGLISFGVIWDFLEP
jgi:hypothetical protein